METCWVTITTMCPRGYKCESCPQCNSEHKTESQPSEKLNMENFETDK